MPNPLAVSAIYQRTSPNHLKCSLSNSDLDICVFNNIAALPASPAKPKTPLLVNLYDLPTNEIKSMLLIFV